MLDTHDNVAETGEHPALLWLGKEVGNHFPGWAVHETDVSLVDLVVNEEVSDVDVPGPLSSQRSSFLLHLHSTHVVLVEIAVAHDVPLCYNKISCPDGLWEEVACSNEF